MPQNRDHEAARAAVAASLHAAREAGATALDEPSSKAALAAYGLRVPQARVVDSAEGARLAFAALGGPVAVKVVAPGLHKSDVGGVRLGLSSADAVADAVTQIAAATARHGVRPDAYLVEQMAAAGREIVIGGVVDARFGPVLMLGLGGVFVEVFADTAFRVCPIDALDAQGMIAQLRAAPLLRGARGGVAVDEQALVAALLALGGEHGLLTEHAGAIAEIDVNPLIADAHGAIACDARIILRPDAAEAPATSPPPVAHGDAAILAAFEPLFAPRTMAVVGASSSTVAAANDFIRQCVALGYRGRIVPVHPSAATIENLPAVRSLPEAGDDIDYVYIAVSAPQVPAIVRSGAGRARFAQVISSGFGEVAHGRALEDDLVAAARESGVRVLGPNCLGMYSPRGGLAFIGDSPAEPGPVGVISQSGGLGVDAILRGRTRGIRFSGLATLGNSIDVGPADLLEYYMAEPGTRVIGVYLEDVKDGRRFFEALRAARGRKPVVLLLGGQTGQGRQAAASHTGSLASPIATWRGLAEQTGVVIAETLEQFLDQLVAFQTLSPRGDRPTRRCVLFGNGGGTSVLAADAFARRGLEVNRLPEAAIAALDALALPSGTSVVNPIDAPAFTLRQDDGRVAEKILDIVYAHGDPDAVATHLNLSAFVYSANQRADFLGNLMQASLRVQQRHPGQCHFALVLRSDGSELCEARKREFRRDAMALGVPVFDEMSNVADALAAVARYERFLAERSR